MEEKWGLIANNFNILMNLFVEKKKTSMKLWDLVYKWEGLQEWKSHIQVSIEDEFRTKESSTRDYMILSFMKTL